MEHNPGFHRLLAVVLLLAASFVASFIIPPELVSAEEPNAGAVTNADRLLTDQVGAIKTSLDRLGPSIAKGDFNSVKAGARSIQANWGEVAAELQSRGNQAAVDEFNRSLKALSDASTSANKPAAADALKKLSSSFAGVQASLANVLVNTRELAIGLTVLVLGWAVLSLVIIRSIHSRRIRL